MTESYEVRPSQSPWPRVMRCVGQLAHRSVHRGTAGLGKTKVSGVIVLRSSKILKKDADCHGFERVLAEGLERYSCRDC